MPGKGAVVREAAAAHEHTRKSRAPALQLHGWQMLGLGIGGGMSLLHQQGRREHGLHGAGPLEPSLDPSQATVLFPGYAEPVLVATRKVVPPFNGLDVSPIVWVALLSFLSEILTGPQGILSLIERKGI